MLKLSILIPFILAPIFATLAPPAKKSVGLNVPLISPVVQVAPLRLLRVKRPRIRQTVFIPVSLVKVVDGDTVHVLIDGINTVLRLCGIDAPEKQDPLGVEAKAALTAILKDQPLELVVTGKDLYRRTIGSLYIGGSSVQAKMTTIGLAYRYSVGYCPDTPEIIDGDNFALSNKIGMRSYENFTPPWEERSRRRQDRLNQPRNIAKTSPLSPINPPLK